MQRLTVTRLRRYKFNADTRVVHLQSLAAHSLTMLPLITQLPLLLRLAGENIPPSPDTSLFVTVTELVDTETMVCVSAL